MNGRILRVDLSKLKERAEEFDSDFALSFLAEEASLSRFSGRPKRAAEEI